jgi:hypothetical protein
MSSREPVVEVMDPMVVEIMRKKTPTERLAIAFGMWDSAAEMIQANLRREHPDWSVNQVQRETARRMRGKND